MIVAALLVTLVFVALVPEVSRTLGLPPAPGEARGPPKSVFLNFVIYVCCLFLAPLTEIMNALGFRVGGAKTIGQPRFWATPGGSVTRGGSTKSL